MSAPPSPFGSPASPEHLAQIATSRARYRPIARARSTAAFSAYTTLAFGVITLLTSLSSFPAFLLGAGMTVCAIIEFRAGAELKRLNPAAPKRLAINQLAFGTLLFAYGAWNLFMSQPALPTDVEKELAQIGVDAKTLNDLADRLLYGSIMLAAVVGPGLLALYYRSREKPLRAYLGETPDWILQLQRSGMSL